MGTTERRAHPARPNTVRTRRPKNNGPCLSDVKPFKVDLLEVQGAAEDLPNCLPLLCKHGFYLHLTLARRPSEKKTITPNGAAWQSGQMWNGSFFPQADGVARILHNRVASFIHIQKTPHGAKVWRMRGIRITVLKALL